MGIHYKIVLREMGVESATHLAMHNLYYSAPRSIEFAWLSKLQAAMTALRTDISSNNRHLARRVDSPASELAEILQSCSAAG